LTSAPGVGYRVSVQTNAEIRLVWGILVALGAPACGGPAALESPDRVLAEYTSAIAERDYRAAYARLSERTRSALSYADFVASLSTDADATRERTRLLGREPTSSVASARIEVEGEVVEMVLENGAFRIDGNPAAPFDQHTPRATIRAFVDAIESNRADRLLQLAPPAARQALDESQVRAALESENQAAYAELAAALRASADSPIDEVGATATMRFGIDRTIRLVRIDSLWFIDGID
jgi:hypothetical protein